MKAPIRIVINGVVAIAVLAASFAAGPRLGLPSATVAHACSEYLSVPSLAITTLGDGNKYISASVNYSCVNSNDYITTNFANVTPNSPCQPVPNPPYFPCGITTLGWYPDPSGSGTHNAYKNYATPNQKWQVWSIDQANGYTTNSTFIWTT